MASVVRLYLAAVLAQPEIFPGARLSPASTGAGEGLQSRVPSSCWFPAQLPEQHWSTGCCGTAKGLDEGHWCAGEAARGQLWLLSCEVDRGSVGGQSAQGCTLAPKAPAQPRPAHCYLNLEALHEKNLEFLEKRHLLSPPLYIDPLNESSVVILL